MTMDRRLKNSEDSASVGCCRLHYLQSCRSRHRVLFRAIIYTTATIYAVMLLYLRPWQYFDEKLNYSELYNMPTSAPYSLPGAARQSLINHSTSSQLVQYHLIVEGTFFQMRGDSLSGIAFVWLNLFRHLSTSKRAFSSCPTSTGPQHKVIYLDRSPGDAGSRAISSYKMTCDDGTTRPAVIMVPVERSLEYTLQHKVPLAIAAAGYTHAGYPVQTVYTSTYYTFPEPKNFPYPGFCTILYLHDAIPEEVGWMKVNSQWWPRKTATAFVNSFVSVSKSTLRDYVRWYAPHVLRRNLTVEDAMKLDDASLERETYISVVLNRISPLEFPGPASRDQVTNFRKRYSIASQSPSPAGDFEPDYLFSVGGKNWDFLIRGFDRLPDELIRKFSIVLTGGINLGALGLKHAFEHGPPKTPIDATKPAVIRVYDVGYLPRDLVHVAMTGSYAVVYVSEYEGFGFPIAEGFASGTLVITSDCSSMPEVGGDVAYYVKNRRKHDVAEMAKTFERALNLTKAERQTQVELGLKLATKFGGTYGRSDKYDAWEDAAIEFIEHIKSEKHKGSECYHARDSYRNSSRV